MPAILDELRAFCLSLPEVNERASWGHPNFLAGKKTFLTFERIEGRPSIAFRLHPGNLSPNLAAHAFETPYGRGQWTSLWADIPLDRSVARGLALTAYKNVALKRMIAALGA